MLAPGYEAYRLQKPPAQGHRMFNVIYRWKIHPGKEVQFEKAWAEATHLIRSYRGGLGSRLHRCLDGEFLAYAQWPDQQTWERASSIPLPDNQAMAQMKDAIASSETPIQMSLLQDLFS
jgi:heme-degrading monooxygenase HmoA